MKRNHRASRLALAAMTALVASTVSLPAIAADAGYIKRMEGDVRVIRNKQSITARPGMAVEAKDRVVTGANGSCGITTTDNTLLSLGPNSHMALDQYAFNQTNREGNMAVRFLKGTFAVVSGLIGKVSPEKTRIATPTSTIGIRGTEFVVKVELPAELEAEVLSLDNDGSTPPAKKATK